MNLLLTFKEWLAQNWIIIALIVVAIALLIPTYLRQKKETNARNELNSSIKKGTKIITTAGIYGTVQSIEDTTDGKVVTILTGTEKTPSTMTIHINAIGGIDNKKHVDEEETKEVVEEAKETEKTDAEETAEKKSATAKKSTAKKTTKKSK